MFTSNYRGEARSFCELTKGTGPGLEIGSSILQADPGFKRHLSGFVMLLRWLVYLT